MKKLSVYLGLREKVESTFKNMSDDMFDKFKNKPGLFRGTRKTYDALPGYADDDTKRTFVAVASTVAEQLDWFKEYTKDYFGVVFGIERTNAKAVVEAELIVDGVSWGTYTSLELLRLKSILDGHFRKMIGQLPVRNEQIIWKESSDPAWAGRKVWESTLIEGKSKTTLKDSYIMSDPHADKPGRAPQVAEKSIQVDTGKYTIQDFSGEISMRERAVKLAKLDALYKGVIAALETANDAVVVESDLGEKVVNYLL